MTIPAAAILGWAWRPPAAPGPMTRFAADTYVCRTVAAVAGEPARSRHQRFLRRMGLFAIECAHEAVAHAGVTPDARTGLYAGVGGLRAHWDDIMAGLQRQRDDGARAWAGGLGAIHPFWMLRHLSNNAHALAATDLRACGDGATFGGGTGGAQALAAAIRALAAGAVDLAIVMAYDSLLEPETLVELGEREPSIIPGEAAAAVVLARPGDPRAAGRPRVRAVTGADGERGRAAVATIDRCRARVLAGVRPGPHAVADDLEASAGSLGAATALVQVIRIAGAGASALALAAAAPGLASAVHVELPREVP